MLRSHAMTIGQLSRRTGVTIKALREYERLGFLYTLGRSEGNYRLFGEEAMWCVQVVQGLRSLGLTLKDIQSVVTYYLEHPSQPARTLLDQQLAQALARTEHQIAALQAVRQRILDFQAACTPAQTPPSRDGLARLLISDPRRTSVTAVD